MERGEEYMEKTVACGIVQSGRTQGGGGLSGERVTPTQIKKISSEQRQLTSQGCSED